MEKHFQKLNMKSLRNSLSLGTCDTTGTEGIVAMNDKISDVEFSILDESDLRTAVRILDEVCEENTHCVGRYANIFLGKDLKDADTFFELLDNERIMDEKSVLCTNFEFLHHLFFDGQVEVLRRKIKDKFIFFMPITNKCGDIKVFWGHGFSDEENNNEVHSKWFIDKSCDEGKIYIVNNSMETKKIKLEFNLWSINQGSAVRIKFLNKTEHHDFQNGWVLVKLIEDLLPGCTELSFEYVGGAMQGNHGDVRALKFVVNDLKLQCGDDFTLSGIKAYADKDGSLFYKYALTDNFIRTELHRNGFFEVESFHGMKNGDIQKTVSRFLVNDQIYHMIEGINPLQNEVVLYVANRKGKLHVI